MKEWQAVLFSLGVKYYNLNGKLPHITYEYTVPRPSNDDTAADEGVAKGSAHTYANLTYNEVNRDVDGNRLQCHKPRPGGADMSSELAPIMSSCRRKRRKFCGRSGRPALHHRRPFWSTDQMMVLIICTTTMTMMLRRGAHWCHQDIVSHLWVLNFWPVDLCLFHTSRC